MKALAEQIHAARSILMSTHKDPDGDGIGAVLALAMALRGAGKEVHVRLPDPCPERFCFLDQEEILRVLPLGATDLDCPRPELALIIDTHQWSLLGHVGELVREAGIPTVFLDHHPVRGAVRGDVYGNPDSCSTGELVYRLLLHYLDLPIDTRIGECLYASIAYDTHSFRYVRNSPSPHIVAADLLSRGIDATKIYRHLFASNPIGKMRLLGQILSAIQIEENGTLAWVCLPIAWIRQCGVCEDDLRDTVNCMLEFDGVEVAVMLKEVQEGTIKISLRSKGRFEIHEAAMALGGGGHAFAAGATLSGDLDHARRRVVDTVLPYLRREPASLPLSD
jgi:bifunctional oligoribonuclease and PAP phosphatase NrnA